jgi:hypothetical protein
MRVNETQGGKLTLHGLAAGIEKFRKAHGGLAAVGSGYIVHPGDVAMPIGNGVSAVPAGRV